MRRAYIAAEKMPLEPSFLHEPSEAQSKGTTSLDAHERLGEAAVWGEGRTK